jgi:hypothetical protein
MAITSTGWSLAFVIWTAPLPGPPSGAAATMSGDSCGGAVSAAAVD